MDLIKVAARRSFWSELTYIILNIVLAVGVFGLVRSFEVQPYLAVLLVLLSKWRILAVRPRYWFAHVQSNLVDVIVGLSFVALLYQSGGQLPFQIIMTGLYVAWLLALKPRSHRQDMVWQAGVAQFVGLVALSGFSHALPSSLFVLGVWLIAYATARHVLTTYNEDNIELMSMIYGLLFAELAWFYYHWMVAYSLVADVAVSQLALVALLVGFVLQQLYDIFYHKERVRFKDVRVPLGFIGASLLIILLFFTQWSIRV